MIIIDAAAIDSHLFVPVCSASSGSQTQSMNKFIGEQRHEKRSENINVDWLMHIIDINCFRHIKIKFNLFPCTFCVWSIDWADADSQRKRNSWRREGTRIGEPTKNARNSFNLPFILSCFPRSYKQLNSLASSAGPRLPFLRLPRCVARTRSTHAGQKIKEILMQLTNYYCVFDY